ncbi:MAG: alpha/beta hydrolase family protein, partial [Tepidisphaeraceae bacterium]
MRVWIAILIALCVSGTPTQPTDASGHWEGRIDIPGMGLVVRVDLTHDADKWSGTIDIPQQGARGLRLSSIVIEGADISFSIRGLPGSPTFAGKLDAGRISGTFTQRGMKLPFALGREKVAARVRPQDPKPPLPYRQENVTFSSGDATLAGTLSIPPGRGPFPAAVLISGSGPQNRDEEVMDHRPFLVLADRLTRGGIAVLRFDDRGVGESTGKFEGCTTQDFAHDAQRAVELLKTRSEVRPDRIGLIGHSEGGVIAPMVAAESKDVAFVVMLAGTGVPGDEVLVRQLELILRAQRVPEALIADQMALQEETLRAAKSRDWDRMRDALRRRAIAEQRLSSAGGPATPPGDLDDEIDAGAKKLGGEWFQFFLTCDPRHALHKVS